MLLILKPSHFSKIYRIRWQCPNSKHYLFASVMSAPRSSELPWSPHVFYHSRYTNSGLTMMTSKSVPTSEFSPSCGQMIHAPDSFAKSRKKTSLGLTRHSTIVLGMQWMVRVFSSCYNDYYIQNSTKIRWVNKSVNKENHQNIIVGWFFLVSLQSVDCGLWMCPLMWFWWKPIRLAINIRIASMFVLDQLVGYFLRLIGLC